MQVGPTYLLSFIYYYLHRHGLNFSRSSLHHLKPNMHNQVLSAGVLIDLITVLLYWQIDFKLHSNLI